jgi:hypothetical protein
MTDQDGNKNVSVVAQGIVRARTSLRRNNVFAEKSDMNQHTRPRKPPSETENKIFALLKSIPILTPGITEEHCRGYANYLNAVAVSAHMSHQRPEAQRFGARRTQAELERLSDLVEKIVMTMNGAHQETNALIEAALPKGKSLSQYKHDMNEVIRVLHQADVDAGELTAKGEKPSDEFAAELTQGAAKAFVALTGRKPTVIVKPVPAGRNGTQAKSCGPFLDFLKALFKALGIDASAEYHARQLRRNRI